MRQLSSIVITAVTQRSSLVACFVTALVVLCSVVPNGLRRACDARTFALHERRNAVSETERHQHLLLQRVLNLQKRSADLHVAVAALKSGVQTRRAHMNDPSDEDKSSVRDALHLLEESVGLSDVMTDNRSTLGADLEALKAAAVAAKAHFNSVLEAQIKRFIVKWHNGGVKVSRPFLDELEAEVEFERVGDFAKKLLMFDNLVGKWIVLRAYGGDQWLQQMTNDVTTP